MKTQVLEWVAIAFSRVSSQPRDRTHVSCGSCLAGGFFTTSHGGTYRCYDAPSNEPFLWSRPSDPLHKGGSCPRAAVRRRVRLGSVTSQGSPPQTTRPYSQPGSPRWSRKRSSDPSAWQDSPPLPPRSCWLERLILARWATPWGCPGMAHQWAQCWTIIPTSRQGQRPEFLICFVLETTRFLKSNFFFFF